MTIITTRTSRFFVSAVLATAIACSDSPTGGYPAAVLELRSAQESYAAGSTMEIVVRNVGSVEASYGACVNAVDMQVGASWKPATTFTIERECDAVRYPVASGAVGPSIFVPIPATTAAGVYRVRLTDIPALSGAGAPHTSAVSNAFAVTR